MTEINLDEIVGELKPHKVIVLGTTYLANPDPAVGVLYDLWKLGSTTVTDDGDPGETVEMIRGILVEIFGDKADDIFHSCGIKRVQALLTALMEAYGREGKAPGSSRASRRAGARSKPTSNASTRSTSAKRASERNGSAAAISHA